MDKDLKTRTKKFALEVLFVVEKLPTSISSRAIANQLVRSGTSVAANYRSATRGRSEKEFISKIGIVIEETDETELWLELIKEKGWYDVDFLLKEVSELIAIFVTIVKKVKNKQV